MAGRDEGGGMSAKFSCSKFEEGMGQLLLANGRLKMLVLNPETEVIQRWTPEPPTAK